MVMSLKSGKMGLGHQRLVERSIVFVAISVSKYVFYVLNLFDKYHLQHPTFLAIPKFLFFKKADDFIFHYVSFVMYVSIGKY